MPIDEATPPAYDEWTTADLYRRNPPTAARLASGWGWDGPSLKELGGPNAEVQYHARLLHSVSLTEFEPGDPRRTCPGCGGAPMGMIAPFTVDGPVKGGLILKCAACSQRWRPTEEEM